MMRTTSSHGYRMVRAVMVVTQMCLLSIVDVCKFDILWFVCVSATVLLCNFFISSHFLEQCFSGQCLLSSTCCGHFFNCFHFLPLIRCI